MKARGKVWFTFLEAKATTNIFCSYKLTSKLCLAYLRLNYNKIGSAVPISKKKKYQKTVEIRYLEVSKPNKVPVLF